jgi:hypothetical protein
MIEAKKEHLVDSIAAGSKDSAIFARLKEEETRRQALVRELEGLASASQATSLDDARLKKELKARLTDTKALLGRHIADSRRLLRILLERPLRCEAVTDRDRKESGPARTCPSYQNNSPRSILQEIAAPL